jgi:hypothetical protein
MTQNEQIAEYAPFMLAISKQEANAVNMIEELEICLHEFIKFVQNIPMDKFDFRYAEGKWTIKEIIQHVIDTERFLVIEHYVFLEMIKRLYPVLMKMSMLLTQMPMIGICLLTELSLCSSMYNSPFKVFSDAIRASRVASNNDISVRAIGFILIGHQNIIKKYL